MLILKENEICPHSSSCQYNLNGSCYGSRGERTNIFTCKYANETKVFSDGHMRNPYDKTGKMQMILEQT